MTSSRRSIDRAKDSSGARLEELARHYAEPLKRYFLRRVRNRSDVPDLVQEVLLRLSRTGNLSSIDKPENYLFTTAANALRDQARRDQARHRDAHVAFDLGKHDGTDFSPERIYVGREAMAVLQEALRALPERTRDVFILRIFEEQKTSIVAESMRLSTRSVEMHYAKALAHVAAALREYRDE